MRIGIYIYDGAEVLDFAGPFEVFSTAARFMDDPWEVVLIAEAAVQVKARGGFTVSAQFSITDHPDLDLLIVVGGVHIGELEKASVIDWIARTEAQTPRVASVCTGAFLLAEAGLLDGATVTTHWEDIPELRSSYPALTVIEDKRWVNDGKYTTSGGISAGIDMSLHLVAELAGMNLAEKTARQMEYRWQKLP